MVITTAAVPGRQAPVLVTTAMVERMAEGSVIVDMAADRAATASCPSPARTSCTTACVVGLSNPPSAMPTHASFLYSRNVANFLALMVTDGRLAPTSTTRSWPAAAWCAPGEVAPAAAELLGAAQRQGAAGRTADARIGHPTAPAPTASMTGIIITVFVLAAFVGYEVVSKVPSILHTPLMSGSNAIHGIILVGHHARPGRGARRRPADPRLPGRGPRHLERGRRLRRHRPDAPDVQGQAG